MRFNLFYLLLGDVPNLLIYITPPVVVYIHALLLKIDFSFLYNKKYLFIHFVHEKSKFLLIRSKAIFVRYYLDTLSVLIWRTASYFQMLSNQL